MPSPSAKCAATSTSRSCSSAEVTRRPRRGFASGLDGPRRIWSICRCGGRWRCSGSRSKRSRTGGPGWREEASRRVPQSRPRADVAGSLTHKTSCRINRPGSWHARSSFLMYTSGDSDGRVRGLCFSVCWGRWVHRDAELIVGSMYEVEQLSQVGAIPHRRRRTRKRRSSSVASRRCARTRASSSRARAETAVFPARQGGLIIKSPTTRSRPSASSCSPR